MTEKFSARPFMKHAFKKDVKVLFGSPRIILTHEAYDDMRFIVGLANEEVGWLGTVSREDCNFKIEKILLIEQEANMATCEITSDGLSSLATKLLASPEGQQIYNSLRFWGHSHVRMGTSPSAQDNKQMEVFLKTCEDFFIRGILNKEGRMEFDLYLIKENLAVFDCEWELETNSDEDRLEYWRKEIETKVKSFSHINNNWRQRSGLIEHGQTDLWDDGFGYTYRSGTGEAVQRGVYDYAKYPYGTKPNTEITKHKGQTGVIVNGQAKGAAVGGIKKKSKEKIKKREWIHSKDGLPHIKNWF